MNDIVFSNLAQKLIDFSKTIGKKDDPLLTAERFIVAVINYSDELVDSSDGDELDGARMMLEAMVDDKETASQYLVDYLLSDSCHSLFDNLYMRNKLQAVAKDAVKRHEQNRVDAENLVYHIMLRPSRVIADMVREVNRPEPEAKPQKTRSQILEDIKNGRKRPQTETVESVSSRQKMAELVDEVKRIRNELSADVFGQDNAIDVFVNGYFQANIREMVDSNRFRPRATYLFAGPPGVGKTFLAEKIAQSLKLPFMRFDMSEYVDKEANLEFCGSDKVYKNGKEGNVTGFVAKNPKCVLLFDEIEKAHLNVIYLFLQMLDAGRLRDNYTDNEVSFTDAIIILTTNAGKKLYEDSESGDFSGVSRKVIIKALEKDINPVTNTPFFPSALCSRFASGNVVMFNHIGAGSLRAIAEKEIRRNAVNLQNSTGISFDIDDRVFTALLFSEGAAADARTVRGRAESFLNDEFFELLRLVASSKSATDVKSIEKVNIKLDLSGAKQEVSSLFKYENLPSILVFAEEKTVELCRSQLADFEIIGADCYDSAVKALEDKDIGLVMVDVKCGASAESLRVLNIEDTDSEAGKFCEYLNLYKSGLPVYVVEDGSYTLSDEERTSFIRKGIRGFLSMLENSNEFAERVIGISSDIHQQACLIGLARQNKLVSYKSSQSVSTDGKVAEIKLYGLGLAVAVDSEDSENVLSAVSKPNVKFDEVIGAEDAKKELKYFVEYLKNPKKYMGTGVKAPKGILLYGPPGTGKTMLAKAMASEADVTYIATEGNQFIQKYIGEGPEKVHEMFRTARKYAPSVLFIDEIDAIAKERRGTSGGNSMAEDTLTAFLTEMDGFKNDPSKPVFVLAATNFDVTPGGEKSLDPALMRRFDRRVLIDLPKKEDRLKFLKMKIASNKALDISEGQIENIAVRSTGMSLAEIDSAIELALRSAIRNSVTKVTDELFEEAFETFNNGETKAWDISQLERVARHEAGHAFLCWLSGETPSYLTIVARGNHGGYMQHADNEGKMIYTKDELLAKIRTALGGRASEIVYYGENDGISTGASGDLVAATHTAKQLLCSYGMDDGFGLSAVETSASVYSEQVTQIREATNIILREQLELAVKDIYENKSKVDALIAELMIKNYMSGEEIDRVLR